jgi:GMP synthase-like glutamine amidotransferase
MNKLNHYMRIHYLQHVPFEGPGYIADWIETKGHQLSSTRFYETSYALPDIDSIDALIIMGGPMGVYDDHLYPWLLREKAFIEDCIDAGKKVLGICLGAQLIAVCLGAQVCTAPQKEIGWYPLLPTAESKALPWFEDLVQAQPYVLHWHGDKFGIPYGAYELARTEANGHQAFCYKDHVLGLQFHLQATPASVAAMLAHETLQHSTYVQDVAQLSAGTIHCATANQLLCLLLDQFFEQAGLEKSGS